MKVKICGITNEADARAAVDAGADLLGFILFPGSKRCIRPEDAARVAESVRGEVEIVAVAVNPGDDLIMAAEALLAPDIWQLHGEETPGRCVALGAGDGRRLVKAVGLPHGGAVEPADYPVEAFLMDKASPERGGTGQTFDWDLAVAFQREAGKPCFLSGGLNPNNIVQAIEAVHPYGVDVSSGVESAPGRKDHALPNEFVRLCRR